jgi:hypothetical protein
MIDQLLLLEAVRLITAALEKFMHDPFHIFRAAEILSQAIVFAGLTALATSIISCIAVIVVTHAFTRHLRYLDSKKVAAVLLLFGLSLGASGCGEWG